jgi:hypothetical protein
MTPPKQELRTEGKQEVVVIPSLGEPALPPLSHDQLRLICSGLLNPSQGAAKSMARELRVLRGDPNPDAV